MEDKAAAPHAPPKSEETRQRLILAALDVFGRHGLEAATTREIAAAAGVNLQAIPYHFGGKDGLYQAVAGFLVSQMRARVLPRVLEMREEIAAGELGRDEAREALQDLLCTIASLMISHESAPWARFIIREQMQPTAAFDLIYEQVMGPVTGIGRALVGLLLEDDPASDRVGLRAFGLFGQVLMLRAARAALLRSLDRTSFDSSDVEAVHRAIAESIASLRPAEQP